MLRHLEDGGTRLGCVGADSAGWTRERSAASPFLFAIDRGRTETVDLIAWTQYGMFRRSVFDDGVRFDDSGPFRGAGWGFEDNDLAFQMQRRGYVTERFFGLTYLHRDIHSSIRVMKRQGVNAQAVYEARKQHVIRKWAGVPEIDRGPLQFVRRVQMQF